MSILAALGNCGKIAFPTKVDAEREAERLREQDRLRGRSFDTSVFCCAVCNHAWHVGRRYRQGYSRSRRRL